MQSNKLCPKKISQAKGTIEDVKSYLIMSPCPYTDILFDKIHQAQKDSIEVCECSKTAVIKPSYCPKKLSRATVISEDVKLYLIRGKCPYTKTLVEKIKECQQLDFSKCDCF